MDSLKVDSYLQMATTAIDLLGEELAQRDQAELPVPLDQLRKLRDRLVSLCDAFEPPASPTVKFPELPPSPGERCTNTQALAVIQEECRFARCLFGTPTDSAMALPPREDQSIAHFCMLFYKYIAQLAKTYDDVWQREQATDGMRRTVAVLGALCVHFLQQHGTPPPRPSSVRSLRNDKHWYYVEDVSDLVDVRVASTDPSKIWVEGEPWELYENYDDDDQADYIFNSILGWYAAGSFLSTRAPLDPRRMSRLLSADRLRAIVKNIRLITEKEE